LGFPSFVRGMPGVGWFNHCAGKVAHVAHTKRKHNLTFILVTYKVQRGVLIAQKAAAMVSRTKVPQAE
jgi:hypothetical protein